MPIDFIHLNERNENLRKYTKNITPCIVGKTSTNYVILVSKEEIANCKGEPKKLAEILKKKLSN